MTKEGHVCGALSSIETSDRKSLGSVKSVTECALKCKAHANCTYFSFGLYKGTGIGFPRCNWEKTSKPNCPSGFVQTDEDDFYALRGNI